MNLYKHIITASFLLSTSAYAYPTHLFWCGVKSGQNEPTQKIQFQIEDRDLQSGKGTLSISDTEIAVNREAIIHWGNIGGRPAIVGIEMDLGRTGHVKMLTNGEFDSQGLGLLKFGKVFANLRGFNYPQGIDVSYCRYFKAVGPKPGLTGAN